MGRDRALVMCYLVDRQNEMKTRMKRMWCSVLLLYSVVTIWSFRNSIHSFSFEANIDQKYAVSFFSQCSLVSVHFFAKRRYAIVVGVTSLF